MTTAGRLLSWYARHGRDLPWRHTRDPYAILVSECMLQQTQVARGLVFYPRWLARFPDWAALAAATNAEVIEAWSGLGYNRRALMLRDVARAVVTDGVPKRAEAWRRLKGIGPYTAAALGCFADGERVLPIDTNVRRVLGRALLGRPFPEAADDDAIRAAADPLLRSAGVRDIPQALFDLASLVCKKSPACGACPLRTTCPCAEGFLAGTYAIPKRTVKKANESRHRDKPHPDRIYRGRIVRLVRTVPGLKRATIGPRMDPDFDPIADTDWLRAMLDRLERDGMIHEDGGLLKIGSARP